MTIWNWIARHGGGVQRREDWARLLGELLPAWEPFLESLANPVGAGFWAPLGGGEEEYVVHQDGDGFWAVPVDGGAPRRLNPTEAEFARLDLDRLLMQLCSDVPLDSAPRLLRRTSHAYALGHRDIEGRKVAVFFVPRAADLAHLGHVLPVAQEMSVSLALVPSPAEIPPEVLDMVRRQRIVVGELPLRSPWAVDWSPLANATGLGFSFGDLGSLCRRRFVLIVDKEQQKVWLEGRLVKLKAGSQPYKLLEHLAERPGIAVTNDELANRVLSSAGSMESKIIDDAKRELKRHVRIALQGVIQPRITVDSLISADGGRQTLTVPANWVFVRS